MTQQVLLAVHSLKSLRFAMVRSFSPVKPWPGSSPLLLIWCCGCVRICFWGPWDRVVHLSTDGIGGLAGCECNRLSSGLVMSMRPTGLAWILPTTCQRDWNCTASAGVLLLIVFLAYLCEGQTVAMVLDCKSCLPLYITTVISGNQLNVLDDGGRPWNAEFNEKRSRLIPDIFCNRRSSNTVYLQALNRKICSERRSGGLEIIEKNWYRVKNSKANPSWDLNCNSVSPDKVKATNSRGPHDRLTVWQRRPEEKGSNFCFYKLMLYPVCGF